MNERERVILAIAKLDLKDAKIVYDYMDRIESLEREVVQLNNCVRHLTNRTTYLYERK
jgi:hypothetical protein